jgi:two-component system, sensor histidine kinase and response regulator
MSINLLMIEDSIDDMTLMQYHLRKNNIALARSLRVETADQLVVALKNQTWDIIVSDFRLPRFDIFSALEIYKHFNLTIPFIIVSGRVGEEAAALALKNGAHDFVSKDNISKLGDVVLRELKRSEERRERALMEDQLRLANMVFENTSEGIIITDERNRIISVNSAFQKHTGYSEKDVLGANPNILSSKTMPIEFYKKMWAELLEKGHWQGEIINRKKSGELYPEWLRINAVKNQDNKTTNYVAILTDFTDKKKNEQELLESNQKLQIAIEQARDLARQAQAANLAKRDFLANMSHEIRTPMHVIIGMSEFLQSTQLNQAQQNSLRMILDSSHLLLGIINDILDFSKIEANALTLEKIPFQPRELIQNLTDMLSPRMREKNLQFKLSIDPDMPTSFLGDPLRIKQILLNLLSNAIKFTHQGGIELICRCAPQSSPENASSSEKVWNWVIEVHDTGIGIEPELQTTIFNPFEQADTSTTRKYGGSGLGLTICRRLVESMQGTISLRSQPQAGSCFTVQIPLLEFREAKQVGTVAPTTEPKAEEKIHATEQKRPTILLVEDCEPSQILGTHLLNSLGYDVEIASNGFEAVSAVQQKPIDLVLMDVQMPGMDGLEATRTIRAEAQFANLPIVAMTAHVLADDHQRCVAAGMNDYLTKPLDRDIFAGKIAEWLSKTRTTRSK